MARKDSRNWQQQGKGEGPEGQSELKKKECVVIRLCPHCRKYFTTEQCECGFSYLPKKKNGSEQ